MVFENGRNVVPHSLAVMQCDKNLGGADLGSRRKRCSRSSNQDYAGVSSQNCQGKPLRYPVPETRTQHRRSVLRLHPNLLQNEVVGCEVKNICKTSDGGTSYPRNGLSAKPGAKMKTRSKLYNGDGPSSNETDSRIDTTRKVKNVEITTSSELHITPTLEQNCKDPLRLFDGTDLASETFSDLASPNLLAAWQPGDWNEPLTFELSPLSPPITPRPPAVSISLECPPFETFYDSLPSESTFPIENTQLFEELVAGKRAKRELPKKCRKVYGIENKKAWCTQCRWKKACTRFNS